MHKGQGNKQEKGKQKKKTCTLGNTLKGKHRSPKTL